ncbi:Rv0909 family putative TA system antitoxin [Lysinibacter cavernae]|uniref:Antitoxin n=1 Tax=Lysinibacter cavernae TaxID=1640652 RepID=A0A7X5TUB5_9MICO|nr:Rv0909 family putative TA system antitoxin [Lysinibacter cavernae]NIH54218.1 hypothetical protein [Lysinibacter cavernae]
MSTDDLFKKAQDFVTENKDKIAETFKSEKAEDISDKLLDTAEGLVNKATGDKFADKVSDVKSNIDKNVGNQ